ncbi:hypothetical protein L1049_022310 [Liquidambar formosana]|uniref:RING-type domain-containing protein n=1 Tax=Liquidambar formosana TaxID=63359 RepID=A0AAP0RC93_LIQFO
MENTKAVDDGLKLNSTTIEEEREEQNPNSATVEASTQEENQEEEAVEVPSRQSSRTPFTNLSQVDADLALARTLQEQERAFMLIRINNNEESDDGSWDAESYLHEDYFDGPNDGTDVDDDDDDNGEEFDGTDVDDDGDAFDVHAHDDAGEDNDVSVEIDPAAFPDDEAYARALQDAEERDMAARLFALAGLSDREAEDIEDHGGNSQDTWEDVDPDELSYEELLALGEVVGTENRGLSADTIASLPSINYNSLNSHSGSNDSCVICRVDYDDGDTLTVLPCKHLYHSECINNWLKINKVCPVCLAEVSTSEKRN